MPQRPWSLQVEGHSGLPPVLDSLQPMETIEHTVTREDHTVTRGEHTVTREDHTVTRGDHTVTRGEHTVTREDHTITWEDFNLGKMQCRNICLHVTQVSKYFYPNIF